MWLSPTPRILYVDDDRDSCELISLTLRYDNPAYQITTVSICEEALSLIESNVFDLYILDYAMPNITGVELCRKIRQTQPDVPVMFYSGLAYVKDKNAALLAGANEYLVKPTDWEILAKTVF